MNGESFFLKNRLWWIKEGIDQKVSAKILKIEESFEKEMMRTGYKNYDTLFDEHIKKIKKILSKRDKKLNEWRGKINRVKKCLNEARILEN